MQVKSNTIKQELSKKSFEVIYKKSLAYKQKNELVKAIESYSKLIERIQHRENCVDCAKVYVDVGDIYFEINDFQHAFEYLEKASQIYAFNHLHELQLLQYKKIGGLQQNIWQFKKAIDIFHQGLSLATRLNNVERIIEFELLIGNALNWDDQLIASEQYLQSAINKEKKHTIPLIKLRAHVSYAILLRKMKNYKQAEKYFRLGMKYSAENNNAYMMDISKSYGVLQYEIGNYNKTEVLLLQAEKMAVHEGADTSRAVIFEYLSLLYEQKKDYEKSFHYLKKFYERKLELLEKGYSDDNNKLQIKLGLEDAKRERLVAEETTLAKGLFIASISHEIRTPMNIILGTTALMLNDYPKPEHKKYLKTLHKSGENLLGIINDILDISKIEAGKLEIELEPVCFNELLENVVTVMDVAAIEKKLQLKTKLNSKSEIWVQTDGLRLTQIITNLVSNAIKFTAKGSVIIDVKIVNNSTIEIQVIDTGMGIPKDKLATIFEQYEQVNSHVQKKYKGTGLGLSISKKLIELLNGTISVKSKVGIGTTFSVKLPVQFVEKQKIATNLWQQRDAKFLDDKVVLVVDDVQENRFVVVETLKLLNKNIQTVEAENGLQVLELIKKSNFDLVVMDLDMPEMNGFEALSAIRKYKKKNKLKVIASTASLLINGEEEFIEFGFNAYLPKPFTIDMFYSILKKQLQ